MNFKRELGFHVGRIERKNGRDNIHKCIMNYKMGFGF
jgi:hypothetical protein